MYNLTIRGLLGRGNAIGILCLTLLCMTGLTAVAQPIITFPAPLLPTSSPRVIQGLETDLNLVIEAASAANFSVPAGTISILAGDGSGANGGAISIIGGSSDRAGGSVLLRGGTGDRNQGGNATLAGGSSIDGDGGDARVFAGDAQDGTDFGGDVIIRSGTNDGNDRLGTIQLLRGFTGVGTTNPQTRLDVRGNNLLVAPPNTSGLGVDRFVSLGESGGPVGTDCPAYGYRVQQTFADNPVSLNVVIRQEADLLIPTISFGGIPLEGPVEYRDNINDFTNRLDFLSAATDGDPACGTRLVSIIDDENNTDDVVLDVAGEIASNGSIITSDLRLKQDIQAIDNPLEIIMALRGVNYYMRVEEFPDFHFNSRLQTGFIAQEVEAVIPHAVFTRPSGYKAINYDAIIPVLTAAIQEQQILIEELQAQIETLNGAPAPVEKEPVPGVRNFDLNGTQLFQNAPNPFSDATRIEFELARPARSVEIFIFDMQGKQVDRIAAPAEAGLGSVEIKAATLDAGMYLYSLIVDGQEVDTKRMIIAKQ